MHCFCVQLLIVLTGFQCFVQIISPSIDCPTINCSAMKMMGFCNNVNLVQGYLYLCQGTCADYISRELSESL